MIGSFLSNSRFDKILRLLDREREIILNGPLTDLKPVVDKRETALAAILTEEANLPAPFIAALRARAERNSRLLAASLAGLKAAEAQIEKIRTAQEQLRTYTAEGTSVEVSTRRATREERR
jgi:hypothetical protein